MAKILAATDRDQYEFEDIGDTIGGLGNFDYGWGRWGNFEPLIFGPSPTMGGALPSPTIPGSNFPAPADPQLPPLPLPPVGGVGADSGGAAGQGVWVEGVPSAPVLPAPPAPVETSSDEDTVVWEGYDIPPSGETGATDPEDDGMAVDWGDIAGQVIGGLVGDYMNLPGTPPISEFGGPMGPIQPGPTGVSGGAQLQVESQSCRYVTLDTHTGKVGKCRRRRRRRLLTPTDISDLAALVAIAGKGAGMNLAIAKAVRR